MKRTTKDGKKIDIKDMETSHIKNCIKAIKEWRIMNDYIDWTYWSTAEECDAWYVDRSIDRRKVLDEFEKELNRREMADIKDEMAKMKVELRELQQARNEIKDLKHTIANFGLLCIALKNDWVIEEFSDWDWDWEHWYVVNWYVYNWKPYEIDWYSF